MKSRKVPQPLLMSSATKATFERVRKAKELLQKLKDNLQVDKEVCIDMPDQDELSTSLRNTEEDDSVGSEEVTENSTSDSQTNGIQEIKQTQISVTQPKDSTTKSHTPNDSGMDQQKIMGKTNNPYLQLKLKPQQGIIHARPQRHANIDPKTPSGSIDKQIILKKGMLRPHVHHYTFGLDRSDKSIPNLCSTFNVTTLDSYYSLKRYFSRLSPCSDEWFVWCSIILAKSSSFASFMVKTRHSLENQAFSLWPKASDHELATDPGWLLYSTRQQDEKMITELLSTMMGEKLGVKWKAIWTTGATRIKDKDNEAARVYALHLECAADCAQEVRQKLSKWYGSASKRFPNGTKMRLVPPFNTILSSGNRQKYAS
jgi:hypothetical protein